MATPQIHNKRAIFSESITRPGFVPTLWPIALCAFYLCAYPSPGMTRSEDTLIRLRLEDVHPLHGGQNMVISSDGTALSQVVTWRKDLSRLYEVRYKTWMSPVVLSDLARLSNAAADAEPPMARPGFPDEARPTITATFESQRSVRLSKWANDQYPKFDSIYSVLIGQLEKARRTSPIYEGPYDPRGLLN